MPNSHLRPSRPLIWVSMMGSQGADFLRGSTPTPAFAPHHVKGLTAKKKCVIAVAVTVAIAPLHPRVATIVWQAIPPSWNQSPLRPALNPQSCLLSPLPLMLPLPLCNCVPLAKKQFPASCRLLPQSYPCRGAPLASPCLSLLGHPKGVIFPHRCRY